MDDTLFVMAAKQIRKAPLDPFGFQLTWEQVPQPMSEVTQNPPLASYYIALIADIAGWSERALHLGFLLPALVMVLGTYRLASHFTRYPLLAALATLLTPGVVVSASGVMCDTTMLALWVLAMILWIEALEPPKALYLASAGMLITAAALSKYFGAALIPLLLVYSVLRLRAMKLRLLYLAIPLPFLAAYQYWTVSKYGHGMLLGAAHYAMNLRAGPAESYLTLALVGMSFAGGAALSALTLAPLVWQRKQIVIGLVVAAGATLTLMLNPAVAARPQPWLIASQLLLFSFSGLSLLALALSDYWSRRDAESALLGLWIVGTLVFTIFVNWSINVRSVLPLIPAAGILLARRFPRDDAGFSRRMQTGAAIALGVSGIVSIWVAAGDAALANVARDAAATVTQKLQGETGTLWFEGHWGFQYYMELRQAQAVNLSDPKLNPGDWVVLPLHNTDIVPVGSDFIDSRQTYEFPVRTWSTTMNWERGAGFYSFLFGPMPFALGPVPPEPYSLYHIKGNAQSDQPGRQ
jgi:4-amino-4-deoxy-L-arabinose transferase-like glycosyltransferase